MSSNALFHLFEERWNSDRITFSSKFRKRKRFLWGRVRQSKKRTLNSILNCYTAEKKSMSARESHYIGHFWTIVSAFAELCISSINGSENFSLLFNKKLGKWPRFHLCVTSGFELYQCLSVEYQLAGHQFGAWKLLLVTEQESHCVSTGNEKNWLNFIFFSAKHIPQVVILAAEIDTTSRVIAFFFHHLLYKLYQAAEEGPMFLRRKGIVKSKCTRKNFAKYQSVLHFFYFIHVDDTGLLFTLTA